MKDEKDKLLDELFRKARLVKPDTSSVEAHFETRLMAALEEKKRERDLWSSWAWRLVPWLAVIVLVIGIGNYTYDAGHSSDPFSALTGGDDDYQVVSLLTGE